MAKNSLFNFLLQNEEKIELPHTLILDTNKSKQSYYRLECSLAKPYVVEHKKNKYQLKKHHVSVYQNESRENPNLSQYHYTAKLINQDQIYRVHAYFDGFDEFTKITFEKKTSNGYQSLDCSHLKDQFIKFAIDHSKPLLQQLRLQHNERIKHLKEQCKIYDEQLALYFDSDEESAELVLKITKEICHVLQQVVPIIRSPYHASRLRFHQRSALMLEKFIKNQEAMKNCGPQKPPVEPVQTEVSATDDETITEDSFREEKGSSDTSMLRNTIVQEISELRLEFEVLTKKPVEVQAQNIEVLLARAYAISVACEDKMKLKDLRQLEKIGQKIKALGAHLLSNFLDQNQLAEAGLLASFYPLISCEKYFLIALQTQNSNMLDLVLTHADLDLNDEPLTLDGKKYPSAMHYCIAKHASTTPMEECISVLVKHEASLLALDDKGLPLAYSIFTKDKNLFHRILHKQPERLHSSDFFNKLTTLLHIYLSKDNLSTSEVDSIQLALKNFELKIKITHAQNPNPASDHIVKKQFHQLEAGASPHPLFETDLDILQLRLELEENEQKLLSQLTKAELRSAPFKFRDILERQGTLATYKSSATKEEIIQDLKFKKELSEKHIALKKGQKSKKSGKDRLKCNKLAQEIQTLELFSYMYALSIMENPATETMSLAPEDKCQTFHFQDEKGPVTVFKLPLAFFNSKTASFIPSFNGGQPNTKPTPKAVSKSLKGKRGGFSFPAEASASTLPDSRNSGPR